MRSAGLRELVLGGFEVFRDVTRIPIRSLTLLYGPNSAGKSALEEALSMISGMCTLPEFRGTEAAPFDTRPNSLADRVKRSWRRESDDPPARVAGMTLGATADFPDDGSSADGNKQSTRRVEDLLARECSVNLTFRLRRKFDELHDSLMARFAPAEDDLGLVLRDVELHVNGVPVLEFKHGQFIAVNFGHSLFFTSGPPQECSAAAGELPDEMSVDGDWVWFVGPTVRLDENKRLDVSDTLDYIDETPHRLALVPALRALCRAVDSVLPVCCDRLRRAVASHAVPASRKVPTSADLTFLVERSGLGEDHPDFHIKLPGDPRYAALAGSFAATLRPTYLHAEDNEEAGRAQEYGRRVNRMLTDHLFMERGYHLRMDYRVVLAPTEFKRVAENEELEEFSPAEFSLIVKLYLADVQGRRYSFTEVGSGLGYVLPALCEACRHSAEVVLLQQPELHLHPAMQAALGDVLIETSHLHDAMLVETHSEHLLLRVLKRMRQSATDAAPVSELLLEPDDLSVLYFDPKPDGTTTVKRLRVTADGEFLDRWPRGFFAERDQELWDE